MQNLESPFNEVSNFNPMKCLKNTSNSFELKSEIETKPEKNFSWDFESEEIEVDEKVRWYSGDNLNLSLNESVLNEWLVKGKQVVDINSENNFCDGLLLHEILEAKDIFNQVNENELYKARARANPFELIKSVFFMNRAALKMANIDVVTNFMFSNINYNEQHKEHEGPFYFADVCAGPGGFTEYILWRKKWMFKGFGFTLKNETDFNLEKSTCASPLSFSAFYGCKGDGDIYLLENIFDFRENIMRETHGKGVHFMMSDGGFSVEGSESLQEVLSKQLYICQCLTALEVVREHGHFVTKLFDTYTLFSVGVIYLMSKCFEKVAIYKPQASRPANSERYLICQNRTSDGGNFERIRNYFRQIVQQFFQIKADGFHEDINEIIPLSVIKGDQMFFDYICEINNKLAKRQLTALKKMTAFYYNSSLKEIRQTELREKCLRHWKIPDNMRVKSPKTSIYSLILESLTDPQLLTFQPRENLLPEQLKIIIDEPKKWHYILLNSYRKCHYYAAVEDHKVYRLEKNNWKIMKNLNLVKGTVLYGEMLTETIISEEIRSSKQCLHVIDALKLGETNLEDKNFNERLKLIKIYCESINHECRTNYIRIRAKDAKNLTSLTYNELDVIGKYPNSLDLLGINSTQELHNVNCILLLKTDERQSYASTTLFRIIVFVSKDRKNDNDLLNYLYSILKENN